jgi:hypothetical protein
MRVGAARGCVGKRLTVVMTRAWKLSAAEEDQVWRRAIPRTQWRA